MKNSRSTLTPCDFLRSHFRKSTSFFLSDSWNLCTARLVSTLLLQQAIGRSLCCASIELYLRHELINGQVVRVVAHPRQAKRGAWQRTRGSLSVQNTQS